MLVAVSWSIIAYALSLKIAEAFAEIFYCVNAAVSIAAEMALVKSLRRQLALGIVLPHNFATLVFIN